MPLTLRKALAEDADTLAKIYLSAFSKDAVSLLVFPRNEASYQFWYDSISEEINDEYAHFVCIVDTDTPTLEIVAYAKWNAPSAPIQTDITGLPAGTDQDIANHFFGNLFKRHAEIMEGRKHWYLELLATRPEYQGKGAGGQLLRWGMTKADEEGTETYLEASPDGKPIYEHMGFKEVDRLVVPLKEEVFGEKEFVECFMVRPVKKAEPVAVEQSDDR